MKCDELIRWQDKDLTEYYEADSVDAVLAEKDKTIKELVEKLNNSRDARKYWRNEFSIDHKELRHSNYKRCLAMARMCEERSARYDVLQERHDLDWGREIEFYYRWYKRWLELAEQFKEAK